MRIPSNYLTRVLWKVLALEMVNIRRKINKATSIYHISKYLQNFLIAGVLRSDYVGKNIWPKLSSEQVEQSTELWIISSRVWRAIYEYDVHTPYF